MSFFRLSEDTKPVPDRASIEKAVEEYISTKLRICRWNLSSEKVCENVEGLLWETVTEYVAGIDKYCWHVVLWQDAEDGIVSRFAVILADTRQSLSEAIKRRFIEMTARDSAASPAEYKAWKRAYIQLTR